MVLEYIEGETLADRLKKGALPLDQALRHAIEIADALDKAHRQGVVHRDLKPGNIMLTKSGAKLLDFGLAKLASLPAEALGESGSSLLTVQQPLTEAGSIVGTFQYMAPEQLEGKEADARTDIFAFGTVLYEMITGKRAFQGKSQASLIGAIMTSDPPPMTSLQSMTPPLLDHVVRTCLAKEPEARWQSAADVERELSWIAGAGSTADRMEQPAHLSLRWIAPALAVLVVGVILGVIAAATLRPVPPEETGSVTRFAVALPPGQQLQGEVHTFAWSPNGEHLAYVASGTDERSQLYLRSMDSLEAKLLPGTEDARNPFFSPDGQWVGFYATGLLKKISIQGGAPVIICESPALLGASWGSDETIVFAPLSNVPLLRVAASGGTPEALTTLDTEKGEISHRWPHLLPGGEAVLFNAASGPNWDQWPIVAQSLETGERRVVVEAGTHARYSPTGHLLYLRAGTLMAVPFDPEGLEVTGDAVPVLEGVRMTAEGAAWFALSNLGNLIYVPGPVGEAQRSLVFVDREGAEEPLATPPRHYITTRLSPEGERIAVTIVGDEWDVWVYDMPAQRLTRLTFEGNNQFPIWTPDGSRITFRGTRGGFRNVWWIPADGSGPEEQLTTGENLQTPGAWSPDGRILFYNDVDPATRWDIWTFSLESREEQPFLQTPYSDRDTRFSPDGHWLAYQSDESGPGRDLCATLSRPGKEVDHLDGRGAVSCLGP